MKSFLFVLLMVVSLGTAAKEAELLAEDPELEHRANELAKELRCLVCQNQTIADSHAGLALDLKQQVREMLAAGKSDEEIIDYMVTRYGDFVLYRPPMKPTTILLWTGPALLLLGGGLILFVSMRQRRRQVVQEELTEEQVSRAEALLKQDEEGKD